MIGCRLARSLTVALGIKSRPSEQGGPTYPFVRVKHSLSSRRLLNQGRCIYMIDPSSIISGEERRSQTSFPAHTRSETTISQQPPDLVPDTSSEDSEDDEVLTMSSTEIRVIRRIAAKSNILPVIAHADSLTDDKLQAVKKASRFLVSLGVHACHSCLISSSQWTLCSRH